MASVVVLVLSVSLFTTSHAAPSKSLYCSEFTRRTGGCAQEEWVGIYRDLFSPDDVGCPDSLRYIDLDSTSGELQVSASGTGEGCAETWGRRFDSSTSVNPVVVPQADCEAQVSFLTKVPQDAPVRQYAEAGALNFTLSLGCLGGGSCEDTEQLLKWNGMYNGQGGQWSDGIQPPSDCDNFWGRRASPSDCDATSVDLHYRSTGVAGAVLFSALFVVAVIRLIQTVSFRLAMSE